MSPKQERFGGIWLQYIASFFADFASVEEVDVSFCANMRLLLTNVKLGYLNVGLMGLDRER